MNLAIMVLLEIKKDNMGVFKFIVINDKIE